MRPTKKVVKGVFENYGGASSNGTSNGASGGMRPLSQGSAMGRFGSIGATSNNSR